MRLHPRNRYRQQGQTLIIALLVLGVLLILGAVFAGILSRTIKSTSTAKQRTQNSDFAEAGIRYAHSELVNSELGADWRGNATPIPEVAANVTRDPDIYYLRPAAGADLQFPGTNRVDQGGPDGLGPFFRQDYRGGRALIRVRYAPGDPSIFQSTGTGYLRDNGLARNHIVIESIGRQGEVRVNDPSLAGTRGAVQYRNFTNPADFANALTVMRNFDLKEVSSKKLIAFAQIGLIDYARFITNKYRSSRPAEIGMPADLGARYNDSNNPTTAPIPVAVPVETGARLPVYNLTAAGAGAIAPAPVASAGSTRVNGDLRIHGNFIANINRTFGDAILASGAIAPADNASSITLNVSNWNGTNWAETTTTTQANTYSPNFTTFGGILRDGSATPDGQNNARGVGYITPPTILASQDSGTNGAVSRYERLTRDSVAGPGVSSDASQFGHGAGVYVDNASDFQVPEDEQGRRAVGGSASLVQDWLSPFGEGTGFRSGWRGPFYLPIGSFLHLTRDGFIISRNAHPDQRPEERTWRQPDGSQSGLTALRYRIGYGTDGELHIVNNFTTGMSGTVNDPLTPADFSRGPLFSGVLYFAGNVRMRGVIPTDVQLTVVTNRTAYIEGNIVKGVEANDVTSAYPAVLNNNRLTRPSRSSLMIMAKEYVTLNPTMFFGPSSEVDAQVENGGQGLGGFNPIKLAAPTGALTLQLDMPLTNVNPANPSTFLPLDQQVPAPLAYFEYDPTNPNSPTGTGARVNTNLLLTQALEYTNPGPSNTFYGLNINRGGQQAGFNQEYQFQTFGSPTNTAQIIWASINTPAPAPAFGNIYGLGSEVFQQSPKFETVRVPIINPGTTAAQVAVNRFSNTFDTNNYQLFMQDTNALELFLTQFGSQSSGNYLLARAAAVPMDIRIEASMYAEEGSFFVIPGDWFNTNPQDRRDRFEQRVQQLTLQGVTQPREIAVAERLRDFGNTEYAPFYGEPIDVRISLVGSVSENMPPPISQQAEWLKKWGWIPIRQAGLFNPSTGNPRFIPTSHVSNWTRSTLSPYTNNLTITYDQMLATGRVSNFGLDANDLAADPTNVNTMVRFTRQNGTVYPLPPMPRLPVSPTLVFFGEAK